ncbi:MAG: TonB-dependent receptor [Sandaracinaceae bacterium]|nr:TonB-dependent receptor [Sandaracinaceae bacterium]
MRIHPAAARSLGVLAGFLLAHASFAQTPAGDTPSADDTAPPSPPSDRPTADGPGAPAAAADSPTTPDDTVTPPRLPVAQHGHPPYPAEGDGRPARVLLQITIDRDGSVVESNVLESDREGEQAALFHDAAERFVRGLTFEPATRSGSAVASRVRFEVLFQSPEHRHSATDHTHPAPEHTHPATAHTHHAAEGTHPTDARTPGADDSLEDPGEPQDDDDAGFGATGEVEQPFQATSSANLRGAELRLRPFGSAGDLLNAGSGFYVIQHAGGGKANQYFLRGFDADHGTDVALHVDGIPVNNVSHGHGQGYSDLQWVIPELISRMEIRKGPYFAEYGDFATAGAVNLVLDQDVRRSSFTLGGGTYGSFRSVAVLSPEVRGVVPTLAVEVYGTDGPFENPEDLRRVNVFGRITRPFDNGGSLSLTVTGHLSDWTANGQLPLREVRAGRLDRFGTLDPNEGGATQRHSVYASLRLPTGGARHAARDGDAAHADDQTADPTTRGAFELTGWLTYYRFALYSNFTYFSANPVDGDMIRQGDQRLTGGLRGAYEFRESLGPVQLRTRAGAQLRLDDIRNSLFEAPRRERSVELVNAGISEGSLSFFVEEDVRYRFLRLVVGARADYFAFNVQDRLEDVATLGTRTSGEAHDFLLSPKATLVVTPIEQLSLFANFGYGFHSNDARGVVTDVDPATPLTRARGYELGARLQLRDRLEVSAAAFLLDLDSEIVWIGDAGTTEPRGATRRMGVEANARVQALPWLSLDLDLTWTNSVFVDNPGNADSVALAPRFMLDSGVLVQHAATGLSGRVGLVYIADRPATEDDFLQAAGFYRIDASVRWETQRFALGLTVQNLTNTRWRQAQFATVSRVAGEVDASSCPAGTRAVDEGGGFAGCEDINFTPGWPFHLMASGSVFF